MCGLAVTIEDGKAKRIEGDRDDPFSRGHVCPKAVALEDIRLDPDRVLEPWIRDGEAWRPLDWTHAVDAAADSLASVVEAHGRDAVAVYLGNPMAHNGHALLGAGVLLGVLRTRMRFSATSADQLPHMLVALEMFGSRRSSRSRTSTARTTSSASARTRSSPTAASCPPRASSAVS